MKKFLIMLLAALPVSMWAQDNNWEIAEEEQQEVVKPEKVNPDEKYLRGAVPLVDGKVVFSKTIEAPGKSADQIYTILHDYIEKMTKASYQIHSLLVVEDTEKHKIGASFEEWLVFKKAALMLDQTRLYLSSRSIARTARLRSRSVASTIFTTSTVILRSSRLKSGLPTTWLSTKRTRSFILSWASSVVRPSIVRISYLTNSNHF